LRALGFIPAGKAEGLWRRRGPPSRPQAASEPRPEPGEPCRIDVWLWRARFCKTRALAAKRVADGEVSGLRDGAPILMDKPSRQIRPGDVLTLAIGGRNTALRVQAVGARRGPAAEARALYTLLSPG
jgi:ribosome-associated heat shock protein Hsp15